MKPLVGNWLDFVEHEHRFSTGKELVGLRGARARETALIGNWLILYMFSPDQLRAIERMREIRAALAQHGIDLGKPPEFFSQARVDARGDRKT